MATEKSATLLLDGVNVHVVLGWNLAWVTARSENDSCPISMTKLRELESRIPLRRKVQTLTLGRGSDFTCAPVGEDSFEVTGESIRGRLHGARLERKVFRTNGRKQRDEWMDALQYRIEQWSELLRRSTPAAAAAAIKEGVGIERDGLEVALDQVAEKLVEVTQTFDNATEWVSTVVDGVDLTSEFLQDFLSRTPLVGAAVPVVVLFLRGVSKLAMLGAEEACGTKIRDKTQYVARKTFREILKLLRSDEVEQETLKEFLNNLVTIMELIENVGRTWEHHSNDNRIRRFLNAERGNLLLRELGDIERNLQGIRHFGYVALTKEDTTVIKKDTTLIKKNTSKIMENTTRIEEGVQYLKHKASESTMGRDEPYKASIITVPRVEAGTSQWMGDDERLEGKLLREILNIQTNSRTSLTISILGVKGMGGIGKTTALKTVGNHPRIQDKFKDGIFWLQLSEEADANTFVAQLSIAIDSTGGHKTANRIRGMDIWSARAIAKKWFQGQCCMFLVDDVWSVGEGRVVIDSMQHIAGPRSVVVFSTRDSILADSSSTLCIKFNILEPRDPKALSILLTNAKYSDAEMKQQEKDSRRALDGVLDKCAGLPLALAIAGRTVLAEPFKRNWSSFHDFLENEPLLMALPTGPGSYSGLARIVQAGYKVLDRGPAQSSYKYTYREMHRSLCVIKKKQLVPVRMLERLWSVNQHEAKRIAQSLNNVGLVNFTLKDPKLGLHDLILDICIDESREKSEYVDWHRRLLNEYVNPVQRSLGSTSVLPRQWWHPALEDDQYIHRRVAQHLVASKHIEELRCLMIDFRWLKRRIDLHDSGGLVDDYDVLIDAMTKASGSSGSSSLAASATFVLLRKAIVMSSSALTRNKRELAFQLHGRLMEVARTNSAVSKLLEGARKYTDKPWVRPVSLCLEPPDSNMILTINTGQNHSRSVAISADGSVVAGVFTEGTESSVRLWDVESSKVMFDLCGVDKYSPLAMTGCATKIVSSAAKNALVWNTLKGVSPRYLTGHRGKISALAISKGGKRVLSGSYDHTARLWNFATGEVVHELSGHLSPIGGVAITEDGALLATGSIGDDGSVRIWNGVSGELLRELFSGSEHLSSLTFAKGDSLVVSGFPLESLKVWQVATGKLICEDNLICSENGPRSVASVGNSAVVVLGGTDERVCIWNIDEDKRKYEFDLGSGFVLSVASSLDGAVVAAATLMNAIRVVEVSGRSFSTVPRQQSNVDYKIMMSDKGYMKTVDRHLSSSCAKVWNLFSGESAPESVWKDCGCESAGSSRIPGIYSERGERGLQPFVRMKIAADSRRSENFILATFDEPVEWGVATNLHTSRIVPKLGKRFAILEFISN